MFGRPFALGPANGLALKQNDYTIFIIEIPSPKVGEGDG